MGSASTTTVAAISIGNRISDFWTDQPRAWFVHLESTLAPQKGSEEVKFNIVLTKLSKDAVTQVTDLVTSPPANIGLYEALRNRLLELYEESESSQLQKLIGEMELGDQKPSQLLRRMRDLARDKIPDATLSMLWQSHLPSWVRGVLTVVDNKNVATLAQVADNILDNTRTARMEEVKACTKAASPQSISTDTAMIVSEIAKLDVRMGQIERSRSRFRNNNGIG